ncbi:hypothetical protein ACWEQL_40910, partial [Kitasatospora sp. NPDC004240]
VADPPATAEAPAAPAAAATPAAAAVTPSTSDLVVIPARPAPAVPGGTTVIRALIANLGPERTASPFTVVITMPAGVTPEGPFFPENCYAFQNGHRVRCAFPAGLPAGRTATARIPVRLAADVPARGTLTDGWVSLRGADDPDETDHKKPFEITVLQTRSGGLRWSR